jgi:D-alanyl-D-alanine carboxypeptidase (penicillin-binding protein 5/6)
MARHILTALASVLLLLDVPTAHGAATALPALPGPVPARQFILIDQANGRTLAAQDAEVRAEPASITKLMTAMVVFRQIAAGRLRLDEPVTISERAWRAEGSRTFVEVGKQVPVEVLLKGMIVQSGNDATIAVAEKVGGTEAGFVQMMNSYAKQLGMKGSNFTNSTGLPDPNLYTTPRDVATLSRALIREFPDNYKWYSMREFVWNGIRQQNRNGLLGRDPSVDGIKTGHTESAGYCLATSASRQGTRLVSAVFGSQSMRAREDASAALLNYGFTFFETVKLRGRGETVLKPRLYKGTEEFVAVGPARDVMVTVRRGAGAGLRATASVKEPLIAPLAAGKAVGELVISDGTRVVARAPLFPLQAVPEGGLWSRFSDTIALWFR